MSTRSAAGGMFGGYKRAPMTAKAAPVAGDKTVLCVDDSAVARMFIRKALEAAGIEVLEAVNAAEANKVLHESPVKLVIVDWNMPGIDGGELVRKLRIIPGMHQAKIVFATSESSEERIEEANEIGCDAFLIKPFKAEDLVACVKELLTEQPPA